MGVHTDALIFTIFLIKLYDDQRGVKCTNYRTILLLFYYKQEVTRRESENASLLKIPQFLCICNKKPLKPSELFVEMCAFTTL